MKGFETIMIIEKNGKFYIVTETQNKWAVKTENDKLTVAYDVPKELCSTADELRAYVLNNNDLF